MSNIKIESFSNANSRKDARKNGSECAVFLENCSLEENYVEPLFEPKFLKSHSVSNVKKIYNYHPNITDATVEELLIFDEEINIVESPLIFDSYKRFYFTKASSQNLMQRTNETESKVELVAPTNSNYIEKMPGISSGMLSAKVFLGAFDSEKMYADLTFKSLTRNANLYTAVFKFNGFTHNNPTGVHFADKLPIRVSLTGLGYLPTDYDTQPYANQKYNIMGFNNEKCGDISIRELVYGDEDTSWHHTPLKTVYYPREIHVVFEIKYLEDKEVIKSHYCQTFVNKYGDEGPPSAISGEINHYFGSGVSIENLSIPSGYEQLITKRRIYRTDSECSDENFKLIAELNATDNSFVDNDYELDKAKTTSLKSFANPPQGLKGIVAGPQGMFAAFVNNEVYITRSFEVLSWTKENVVKLGYNVIALHALGDLVIAITEGTVYSINYSDLEEIEVKDLQCHERCVSAQSVAVVDDKLYFVSKNGLIAITASSCENISKKIMIASEWENFINQGNLSLNEVHCYSFDEKLFIAKRGGSVTKIYNVKNNYFVDFKYGIEAFHYDSFRNELMFATVDKIYSWQNSSNALLWLFKTKKYCFFEALTWAWVKLTFGGENPQASSAKIKFFVDTKDANNDEVLSFDIIGNRAYRLPLLKEGFEWQFEVSSKDVLLDFKLATNYEELS